MLTTVDDDPAQDSRRSPVARDDLALVNTAVDRWAAAGLDGLDVEAMRSFLLMARLTSRAQARIEEDFARHGLTAGEFDVLAALFLSPAGRLTPSELAQLAMVSPAGMTNRVDRLEQAGHVRREADNADRRRRLVAITDQGRSTVTRVAPGHADLERSILAPLSEADQRRLDSLVITLLGGAGLAPDPSS